MIVNGVLLISLYDLLVLVYRNVTDFCVLILYPATLPNSLGTLVALCINCMSSADSDSLTSFHFGFLFISFSSPKFC